MKKEKKLEYIRTTDMEGRTVIDYHSVDTTLDPEGVLTFNKNNSILTFNSGDITHLNFTNYDFMIMFDAESEILTLTSGDKNVYYNISTLKDLIKEQGLTQEETEKILDEKGDESNGQTEENRNQ